MAMEKREYFSVPVSSGTTVSTGKNRNGGIDAERREVGSPSSGSRVLSTLCNLRSAAERLSIYRDPGILLPRSRLDYRPRFISESWDVGPEPHFLDACFLCKMRLSQDRDIFMYRGDIPFCSEECRDEQIKSDEAMEIRRLLSKASASRKKHENNSSRNVKVRDSRTAVVL